MRKSQKSEKQKERNKKGVDRMKRFEENQSVVSKNETSSSLCDIYEECFIIAYQKKDDGDWEQVKIPYKRKKKL